MEREPKFADIIMPENLIPAVFEKTVSCIAGNLNMLGFPSWHTVHT